MRLPRVRCTVRRMMVAVALTGVVLAWAIDRARRGYPLVDFEYPHFIENEPLVNPTKLLAIEDWCLVLEDGRMVRIEDGPLLEGMIGFEDPSRVDCFLDMETGADGSVTVHTLKATWHCGNGNRFRRRLLPLRIPVFPRTAYHNYRALVGTGVVVKRNGAAGL
jgi:hypothetical protein